MNIMIMIGIILIVILFLFSYSACVISSRYSRMEEDEMSIFQEYKENEKIIGAGRIRAIEEYIKYSSEKGHPVLYSDVVYKNDEYELFNKWFENAIQPFLISNYDEFSKYSVTLDVWCNRDVKKLEYAKKNNLNYLTFYSPKEFNDWYYGFGMRVT